MSHKDCIFDSKKMVTFLNLSFVTFQSKIRLFTLLKQTGSQIKFVFIYWSSHLSTRLLGRSLRRISWLMHVLGNYDFFGFRMVFVIFIVLNKRPNWNRSKFKTNSRTGTALRWAALRFHSVGLYARAQFPSDQDFGRNSKPIWYGPYRSQMIL